MTDEFNSHNTIYADEYERPSQIYFIDALEII